MTTTEIEHIPAPPPYSTELALALWKLTEAFVAHNAALVNVANAQAMAVATRAQLEVRRDEYEQLVARTSPGDQAL